MPVDPVFAALLADKRSELRAPPAHVTADVMRAGNKAYLITAPKAPVHAVEDRAIPGPAGPLSIRIYRPTSDARLPVIVFCHGGGFVLGDLDTHDSICHRLAASSACAVVAVDYRRAPQTRFPGAIAGCMAWPMRPLRPAMPMTLPTALSVTAKRPFAQSPLRAKRSGNIW